jgi:transcriptional regulator with XRE-family HTH domain
MDWEKIVGANIRHFRKERGLTQEQLAHNADLDLRYLGGIERGEHNPTVSVLGRLAEALEIHPADLFDEELGDES